MADSSSLSHQFCYDVFLNFRGEDTRTTFADHLYAALVQKGIRTFKDDYKEESKASLKAIEESRCAIVIFSKSYGSSAWCLDELVKIMECNKKTGQLVLPVFYYDFNPSNLRRQGSVFGELFAKYEMDKVRAWTSALVEAANLSGLDLIDDRHQEKRIKEIVEMISSNFDIFNFKENAMGVKHDKLGDMTSTHEKLIGIERRVREVKTLLEVETVKTASKSASASSSPLSSMWAYDVFMCFRGNDACKDFADQLYCALEQQGIYTFSDSEILTGDESIASDILKGIEESSIAVVIFSKNYAAASRCLDELVKIMNCNEEIGQIVLPVFYDVDPSDVRNQKGFFGQAFMPYKPEKIEIWRKALVKAGSLAGWFLNHTPKSNEATIIKSIVDTILRRVASLPSSVDNNLIGIEPRMKYVMSLLEFESGGVRMFGIWGMGGAGKTTIARAVFDQVSNYFDGSCYVENIREVSRKYGLIHVQKELLSKLLVEDNLQVASFSEGINLIRKRLFDRKVLLVLDDVDHKIQLEALAGGDYWFGEGSRIIITTRDENVLVAHDIMQIYYVTPLNDDESIQFLIRHAFKKDDLTKGYEDLLHKVVHYAAGLPLVLKVLSSLLCGKSKKEWTSTLARLEAFPEKEIQDTLKISFDGLDNDVKEIFLDIACFYNGMKMDKVVRILDSCGYSADVGIQLLEQKSLVHISKDCIQMHHLLVQMGRDIVRQMHPDEPGKHSRLWHAEEVSNVLKGKTGTKEISAIVVYNLHNQDAVDMTEAFKGLKNLRLLQIHSHNKLQLLQGLNYLPNNLRWLTWEKYPLRSLPTSFKANKLVGLELVHSSISKLWPGIKYLPKLHFLDLSYSRELLKTPDFTWLPNLEELKLEYCTNLIKVHKSIGSLQRLTLLNLTSCKNLETLPRSIVRLESLKILNLNGCSNLKLPRLRSYWLGYHFDGQMIKVPSSIGILNNLVKLDFSNHPFKMLLNPLGILRQPGNFRLHDTLVDIVREFRGRENLGAKRSILGSDSDRRLISEIETSSMLSEQKREMLPFLPGKGV